MKSAATASHAEKAIVIAGLLCGVLDGIAAAVLSHSYGGTTMRMFQGIARGVLGTSALKGGVATALLGVALHFLIAFGAAAVYYLASRYIHVLIEPCAYLRRAVRRGHSSLYDVRSNSPIENWPPADCAACLPLGFSDSYGDCRPVDFARHPALFALANRAGSYVLLLVSGGDSLRAIDHHDIDRRLLRFQS